MITIPYTLLSLSSSIDQQTGNLSVFELVEEINTLQVPVLMQQLTLSIGLKKSEPKPFLGTMIIHMITPSNKVHKLGATEVKMESTSRKSSRTVVKFSNFPINEEGKTRFVVSLLDSENKKVAEGISDLEVIKVENQDS